MDLNQLRQAGFSDDEINTYSSFHPEIAAPKSMAVPAESPDRSTSLRQAGFSDQEINDWSTTQSRGLTPQGISREAVPTAPVDYGLRVDKTKKGPGFLGELPRPDGKISTELSIGVNMDGKETLIPSLVPTLTQDEINHLLGGNKPTKEIVDKAVAHARQRIGQGMNPFAQEGEQGGAVPVSKPSYLEAVKTGLKSGLAGAMKMYEIPSRPILEATGLAAPGTFASELLQPSEAEQKNIKELGIPGEVVSGVAGLPGAFSKYGPLMAVAPAGILGTAATFAGEKAAEELSTGKIPTPLELGEEVAMGGIFGAIGPLGRLAKAAILGGAFGTQAFAETYVQTKDLEQAFRAAIAPTIIGAGLGVTGGKKKGEPVKPTEQIEPTKPIKTKAEYEQWRDEQLKTISKQVPDLAPEEITTISNMMDKVVNEPTEAVPTKPTEIQDQGLPEMAKVPIQETPPPAPGPELSSQITKEEMPGWTIVEGTPAAKIPTKEPWKITRDEYVGKAEISPPEFVRNFLSKAGDGKPGLSIEHIKREWIKGIQEENNLIVYRDVNGKPVSATEINKQGKVVNLALDKTRGLLSGKAIQAISGALDQQGVTDTASWISTSQDARKAMHHRAVKQALSEGKPVPPEVLKDYPELSLKKEPGISLEQLNANPGLRDYVLKRPEIHNEEVIARAEELKKVSLPTPELKIPKIQGLEYNGIQKGIPGEPDQYVFTDLKTGGTFYTKDLSKEDLIKQRERVRANFAEEKTVAPALSPTAKDQFALPGIKQGLEMKGAKEGVAPTLEGTPLGEVVRRAEAERVQPKLFDVKKQEEKGDILFWIRSKGGIDPDTVSADVKELTQKESGFKGKSSLVRKGGRGLDELAQEWGWEKGGEISTDELADAIKEAVQSKRKGVPRKPGVGSTEQEIDRYIRRQEEDRYRNQIYEEDPNLLKNETFENLTKSFDDEIMGFKEELRDEGYSETDITRAIEQAQKDIKTESRSPDLERIKKELAPEPTGKTPAELVAQKETAQPAPPLSKETKAKYLPAVRADGEVIIGSGTHGSIPPERYSEAQKVEIGFIEPKTGDFLTEAQVRVKETQPMPKLSVVKDLLPPEWKMEVGRTRTKEGHTYEAEVDWKGKRIVFADQKYLDNPDIANHEIAHVLIERLPEKSMNALLDDYVKVKGIDEWTVKNQFHREEIGMDYGQYLNNPNSVESGLRTLFEKYLPKSPEKPISPIGEKVSDVISRLSAEEHTGLTNLGYSDPEINKMGFDSAKASFWNEIKNEKATLPGVETVTAPSIEAKPAFTKEPWEMTREEWVKEQGKLVSGQSAGKTMALAKNLHRQYVRIWLSEGKPVPLEVLKDYPELVKKEIPIKKSAKEIALDQKIAEQEKKIEALKPVEVKPATFRAFLESKGEKWPMKATNPDYQNLKTEWDVVQKGGFSPEERGSFSNKPIPPPIKLAPEEQKVENMISRETRDKVSFTDRVKNIANLTYNNYVDQWHLLGKTVEEMAGGKPSARGEGALASIRLATFKAYGMATTFLEKGIPIKEQREGRLKGDLKFESESLTSIFSDISKDPQKLHAWERYAVSLRAIEKEGQGFHTGIDPKDAKFIVDKYDKQFRPLFDRAKKFQDSLFDYYAEDMLTPELRDKIKAANMLYVPFYRAVEGTQGGLGKNLQASQALRRMKGYKEGEVAAPIIDPIESMVKNTYLLVSNAEKNSALLQFVKFAKKAPQGIDFVREVKPGDEGYPVQSHAVSLAEMKRSGLFKQMVEETGITNQALKDEMVNIFRPFTPHGKEDMITVYEGGKRKFFEVDPTIGRALQGLDKDSVNQIVKILSYPTKMLRAGAVLAPEFMVRNPVRDWFSAMVYAKHGFNPYNFFEGLIEGVGKTDLYYKWIMSGGSQASFVSLDRTDLRKTATELLAKKRVAGLLTGNDYKEVVSNLVRNPIEALRIVSELGEMGTRLGVFERALEAEPTGARGSQRAALASREATIDFGRIGAKSKAINQIIAFWNANVQGLDKLVRELDFRTPSGRQNAMRVATRAVMTITIPSLLLAWANKDDERIKEIPEWQKTMFWLIPTKNHVFRIPKPFELGIIFGTVPEKIMGYLQTNDPETFNKIGTAIATGSMPGLIPTAALPFVENWANKSTFTGRPIVPRGKENLLPEYQYQPYTTETAKKIGGLISHLPLIGDTGMAAPSKVENFIRGWSGGLGNLALKAADKGLEEVGIKSDEIKPSKTWADIPGLRAFVVRYPGADAQSVQDFYDKAEEASQVHATITRLTKEGNIEEASRLIERYPYLSRIYATLNKTKGTMTKMHQLIDKVYSNPNMDPDEKRNLIDEIYLRMIAISRQQMDVIKEGE